MLFKDMKIKDLKNLVLACHDAVNVIECYGTKDLQNLERGIIELKRRGYQVEPITKLSIYKEK